MGLDTTACNVCGNDSIGIGYTCAGCGRVGESIDIYDRHRSVCIDRDRIKIERDAAAAECAHLTIELARVDAERARLADQLASVRSRIDNWDWPGLLRDVRRGDFESVEHALRDVVAIEELFMEPDTEMEKP